MVAAKLIDVGADGRQRIDRYELVAEIATGGMATVYLARLSGMGGFQRFVAIKRLHPHLAQEDEFVQMFLDEARLAAGIHHPNVVPILEVGASEHGYYLVMEYIEGDTLARLLARAATSGNKLPVQIGTRIVVDMLLGLHAAHELRDENGEPTGLVHRDVSPQNILVGVDGSSRITDFGVARAATRLSATRVGQLKGKLAYMAPEQASGEENVDRRADVFSSGIVLWEVLASRRLFKAETEAATLSRVMSEEIKSPKTFAPNLDDGLADVCMKALARDRDQRFADCSEFADALEEAAKSSSSLGAPKEIATYVSEVIGTEIAQQRDAVRAWLARSEPSQAIAAPAPPPSGSTPAAPVGSVSAAAMSIPGPPPAVASSVAAPAVPTRTTRTLAVVALFLFAALGIAVVVLVTGGTAEAPEASTGTDEPRAAVQPSEEVHVEPEAPAEQTEDSGSATALEDLPIEEEKKPTTAQRSRVVRPKAGGARPAAPAARPAAPPKVEEKPAVKKAKPSSDDPDLDNPYR